MSAESIKPTEIKRLKSPNNSGQGLQITWSDGRQSTLSNEQLRRNCPCATCQERRGVLNHEKPLSQPKMRLQVLTATLDEETNLLEIWPIGNYALGIRWGDRHDTGIYSFDILRELAKF